MANGVTRQVKDGKITLKDGAAATLELGFDGEFTWSGGDYEKKRVRDRGALGEVLDGDAKPYQVSFKGKCKYILADTGAGEDLSPHEFLTKTGGASALTSTGPAGEAFAVDIDFEVANPDSSSKKETITFADFRLHEESFSESEDGNEISFSGEAETMTPARAAQA
ncbi:MAG: hypothetical protein ACYS9X_22380 [Planctomycetota bacterium]|jgi:hypothetical protein